MKTDETLHCTFREVPSSTELRFALSHLSRTFLMVQWTEIHLPIQGTLGFNPGTIPHAMGQLH